MIVWCALALQKWTVYVSSWSIRTLGRSACWNIGFYTMTLIAPCITIQGTRILLLCEVQLGGCSKITTSSCRKQGDTEYRWKDAGLVHPQLAGVKMVCFRLPLAEWPKWSLTWVYELIPNTTHITSRILLPESDRPDGSKQHTRFRTLPESGTDILSCQGWYDLAWHRTKVLLYQ